MLRPGKRAGQYRPTIERRLTARQEQVLDLIARGRTNADIATELGLSLDGAKWHVREIMARLEANSREEAVTIWRARTSSGQRAARILGPLFALQNVARLGLATVVVGGGATLAAATVAAWPYEDTGVPPAAGAPLASTADPTPPLDAIPTPPSEAVLLDLVERMERCLNADYPLPTPDSFGTAGGPFYPRYPVASESRQHRFGPCAVEVQQQTGISAPPVIWLPD